MDKIPLEELVAQTIGEQEWRIIELEEENFRLRNQLINKQLPIHIDRDRDRDDSKQSNIITSERSERVDDASQ